MEGWLGREVWFWQDHPVLVVTDTSFFKFRNWGWGVVFKFLNAVRSPCVAV